MDTTAVVKPKYTFQRPRLQNYSIPFPIIKYFYEYPTSGKTWKKLIQTCKYFFSKNPIFPIFKIDTVNGLQWEADGKIVDPKKTVPKLWLYYSVDTDQPREKESNISISSLIPKIYKCELRVLKLICQNLSLVDFEFLTQSSFIQTLYLCECEIINSDNSLVTIDKLLENVPLLEDFFMDSSGNAEVLKSDTIIKTAKIFSSLKYLHRVYLRGLSESFDISLFTDVFLKNETINLCFGFYMTLSPQYKTMLKNLIAKIVENRRNKIPFIF